MCEFYVVFQFVSVSEHRHMVTFKKKSVCICSVFLETRRITWRPCEMFDVVIYESLEFDNQNLYYDMK
jgi:hypothetical protein